MASSRLPARAANTDEILKHQILFSDLSSEELAALRSKMRPRSYAADEIIFHEDDPASGLFILVSGIVKICVSSEEGQESLIALMFPGDCFGEMAVLDGRPRSATAVTLEKAETLLLLRNDFMDFLEGHPKAARNVISLLCQRLRDTNESVADLAFFDIHGRVAKRILQLARDHGVSRPNGIEIAIPITQQDFANYVGASRETVNRAISFFREKGYLSTGDRRGFEAVYRSRVKLSAATMVRNIHQA